jgi:hypothetical protein
MEVPLMFIRLLMICVTLGMVALLAEPARADAIDGEWCSKDGRYMHIQGPNIQTPGGTKMQGVYNRHFFDYVIPEGEADAGTPVAMAQLDEYTIHVTVGSAPAPEVWTRCSPKTS